MGNNLVVNAILIVAAASAAYWGYGEHRQLEQLEQQKETLAKEMQTAKEKQDQQKKVIDDQNTKIADLEQKLGQIQSAVQAQEISDNVEVRKLTQAAKDSWNRMQALQQKIVDLKKQSPSQNADLPTQIQQNKDLVADLESRLKEAQAAEKQVGHASDDAVKNVKAQTQYNTANVNAQIQTQQAAIKATQEQLAFWRKRRGDVNQTDKIALYQQQLTDQQSVLEQLRMQKSGLAQNEQAQTSGMKQEAAQEKENIQSSEVQLRDQLQRAQQDLKALQQQQQSGKKSGDESKTKLHQAEQDYAAEYAKYQSIQDSIKKVQANAQRLKQ